jgi:hypothetical protein
MSGVRCGDCWPKSGLGIDLGVNANTPESGVSQADLGIQQWTQRS